MVRGTLDATFSIVSESGNEERGMHGDGERRCATGSRWRRPRPSSLCDAVNDVFRDQRRNMMVCRVMSSVDNGR